MLKLFAIFTMCILPRSSFLDSRSDSPTSYDARFEPYNAPSFEPHGERMQIDRKTPVASYFSQEIYLPKYFPNLEWDDPDFKLLGFDISFHNRSKPDSSWCALPASSEKKKQQVDAWRSYWPLRVPWLGVKEKATKKFILTCFVLKIRDEYSLNVTFCDRGEEEKSKAVVLKIGDPSPLSGAPSFDHLINRFIGLFMAAFNICLILCACCWELGGWGAVEIEERKREEA